MAVLAVINCAIIIQGLVSCKHKIRGYPKKFVNIVIFYLLAFLSLASTIVYCLSWKIGKNINNWACAYYIIESLPPFLYLLSAYVYLTQSLSVMILDSELAYDIQEKKKKRRRTKICNIIFYCIVVFLLIYYSTFVSFQCKS